MAGSMRRSRFLVFAVAGPTPPLLAMFLLWTGINIVHRGWSAWADAWLVTAAHLGDWRILAPLSVVIPMTWVASLLSWKCEPAPGRSPIVRVLATFGALCFVSPVSSSMVLATGQIGWATPIVCVAAAAGSLTLCLWLCHLNERPTPREVGEVFA